jgi:uncharacterized short protein YbdD (DUF466 family)
MICRCVAKTLDFAAQTARLMLGVPDYDAYVDHLRTVHPNQPPLTRDAFFAARQQARFGAGGLRCC